MTDPGRRSMPLSSLFCVFLRMGLTAYGGLWASIAMLEAELVERRRLLTAEELSDVVAAIRFLPGSSLIQVVSFVGYRLGGWPGSVLSTTAFLLPSAVLMILLAASPIFPTHSSIVASLLHGLGLSVSGVLLATTCRLARRSLGSHFEAVLALGAFASGVLLRVPAALIVVVAGFVGILSPPRGGTGRGGSQQEVSG